MSPTRSPNSSVRIVVAAMMIAGAGVAFAAEEPSTTTPAPSRQMREQMAAMHEQMAACLRSDKSVDECHSNMHEQCHAMGPQVCPMMDMGMSGREGMRRPPPENPDAD